MQKTQLSLNLKPSSGWTWLNPIDHLHPISIVCYWYVSNLLSCQTDVQYSLGSRQFTKAIWSIKCLCASVGSSKTGFTYSWLDEGIVHLKMLLNVLYVCWYYKLTTPTYYTSQSTREAWLNLCAAYWSAIDITTCYLTYDPNPTLTHLNLYIILMISWPSLLFTPFCFVPLSFIHNFILQYSPNNGD